jgi:hypothetical protein
MPFTEIHFILQQLFLVSSFSLLLLLLLDSLLKWLNYNRYSFTRYFEWSRHIKRSIYSDFRQISTAHPDDAFCVGIELQLNLTITCIAETGRIRICISKYQNLQLFDNYLCFTYSHNRIAN